MVLNENKIYLLFQDQRYNDEFARVCRGVSMFSRREDESAEKVQDLVMMLCACRTHVCIAVGEMAFVHAHAYTRDLYATGENNAITKRQKVALFR